MVWTIQFEPLISCVCAPLEPHTKEGQAHRLVVQLGFRRYLFIAQTATMTSVTTAATIMITATDIAAMQQ